MEMLNKCLTAADLGLKQREQIAYRNDQEEIDLRHQERKEMIARRKHVALERQGS